MGKGYNTKIKRGQKIYTSKYSRYSPGGIILTVVIIVALFAAGWFLYTPIFNIITQQGSESNIQAPTQEDPQGEEGVAGEETATDTKPQEKPQERPAEGVVQGAYLTPAELKSKTTLEAKLATLDSKAINTVVVEIKDENGYLLYNTANERAKAGEVVVAGAFNLKEYADAIKAKGFTPVAKIAAFKDPLAKQVDYEMVVKYNNTDISWLDKAPEYGGKSWINPYSSVGQSYIRSIIEEACNAGFEKIILTDVQFPDGYSMETATYPESAGKSKPQALKEFVASTATFAKGLGAQVYVYVEASKALGMDTMVYGANPMEILGDHIALGVMPSLLGGKFQSEAVSIQNPNTTPYETVKAVLEAVKTEDITILPIIQGYTATEYASSQNNLEYTQKEIEDQKKAVADCGYRDYIILNR